MSRAGTGSRPSANALPAQANRIGACIRAGGAVTVAGLAGVAGAISYSHTRQLAAVDSEVAWRTRAFPLSVQRVSWPPAVTRARGSRACRFPRAGAV
jgi:hypothetical protein